MKLLQVIELEKGKCNKCKKNYNYILVGININLTSTKISTPKIITSTKIDTTTSTKIST